MSEEPGLMDVISRLTSNTDEVWKHLICPPKQRYSTESLGPPTQMWGGNTFRRHDLNFRNVRGLKISYSIYLNETLEQEEDVYTIVYLHSHGGCKIEGYHLIKVFSEKIRAHLVLFDFAGCGHSEGDHLSMGVEEPDDVATLLQLLARDFGLKYFAIWGRSMGAAVALLAMPQLSGVFALVLDSPFSEVRKVYRNAVKQRMSLPGVLIDLVFNYANSEIKRIYGFDVSELRPFENANRINIPTVLMGAQEDKITSYDELVDLYNSIPQPEDLKIVVSCKGNHNDDREVETLKSTIEFIQIVFGRLKLQNKLTRTQRTLGGMPKPDRRPMNRMTEKTMMEMNKEGGNALHHSLPRKDAHSIRGLGPEFPSFKAHSVNPSMQRSITAGAMEDSRRAALNSSFGTPSTSTNSGMQHQSSRAAPGPHGGVRRLPLGNFQYSLGNLGQTQSAFNSIPVNGEKFRAIFDPVTESVGEEQMAVVDFVVPVPPNNHVDQASTLRNMYKPLSQVNQAKPRDYEQPPSSDLRIARSFKDYGEIPANFNPPANLPEYLPAPPSQNPWILSSQGYDLSLASQQTASTLMVSNSNPSYQTNLQEKEPKHLQIPKMISPTSSLNIPISNQQKPQQFREHSPRPPPMTIFTPTRSRAGTGLAAAYETAPLQKVTPGAQMAAARDYNKERGGMEPIPPQQYYHPAPAQQSQPSALQNLQSLLNYQSGFTQKQIPVQSDSFRNAPRNPLSRTFGDISSQAIQNDTNQRYSGYHPQQGVTNQGYTMQTQEKIHFNSPANKGNPEIGEVQIHQTTPFEYQSVTDNDTSGRIDPTRSINQTNFSSLVDNVSHFAKPPLHPNQMQNKLTPNTQYMSTGPASKQSYAPPQHKHLLPPMTAQNMRQMMQPSQPAPYQQPQPQQVPFTSFFSSQAHMDKFFSRTADQQMPKQMPPPVSVPQQYEHYQPPQYNTVPQPQMQQNPPILIQSQTKPAFSYHTDNRQISSQYGPPAV